MLDTATPRFLPNGSFAPYGLVQPRSTVIMNLRSNSQAYKLLHLEGSNGRPGEPVRLAEIDKRFYLRADPDDHARDDLADLPTF